MRDARDARDACDSLDAHDVRDAWHDEVLLVLFNHFLISFLICFGFC
jgi:hypothetical protein